MIGQGTVKIAAYPDDIALFIRDTRSLCTFEQTFFEYSQISGAQLNTTTTKALLFASPTEKLPAHIQLLDTIKVLGIAFNSNGIAPKAWTETIKKYEKVITEAERYDLSLKGHF